jgi:hypothetical protein
MRGPPLVVKFGKPCKECGKLATHETLCRECFEREVARQTRGRCEDEPRAVDRDQE